MYFWKFYGYFRRINRIRKFRGPFNEDDLFQASTLLQETLYEKLPSKEKDLIQSMYDIILEFAKTY